MRSSHRIVLLLAVALPACKSAKIRPAQTNADLSDVVAMVDDQKITVGDIQERINKQSPFIRSRYQSLEKKKELLDSIIRFEVMAKEAERKGYDRDPEVVRVMKQQMIQKFLQKEFEAKMKVEDVPDPEVEKYYKEHGDEFNKQDEVRVSQIFSKDEAKTRKAAAEAKAAPKADQKAFRDLVNKYSEDEDSKVRGGDLTFFDKNTTMYPKPLVEAAFKLGEVGDVSDAVKSDKGWHVLKLTQKHPGFSRPLAEVKRQIQQRLFRDLRTKAMDDFNNDLRKKTKVDINEDKLGKVLIDLGMSTGAEGGANASGVGDAMPRPPGAGLSPLPPMGGTPNGPGPAPAPRAPGGPAPVAPPAGK